MKEISWNAISTLVFQNYSSDTNKNGATAMLFAKLWERLVSEYVDDNHINEYNSFSTDSELDLEKLDFRCLLVLRRS